MNTIRHDFRSDTVTRPSAGMRAAMAAAEVGDDVFGDDPTVNLLEQRMAGLLKKEAAIFVPSGTQSNLLALMSHCGRGDEFIAGQNAHCYKYEGGGAAVLGSIQPQPIAHRADGTMDPREIEGAIKKGDSHFATTRVIALENTFGGRVLPVEYMLEMAGIARKHGLGLHLDGARAFNATVQLGIDIAEFVAPFDSVSICLSKGLGAPVGSVLVGRADLIETARRNRKMLGGGMRQAGILAAAGLYAIENNVARLVEDHQRAKRLAEGLAQHKALKVVMPDTNILWIEAEAELGDRLNLYLGEHGVGITGRYGQQRWVTHLDVTDEDIDGALALVDTFFAN
ncbi:low-specificity L-threonine aldolase [Devosia sp.]|uniref:low-specificity L-threonine aldolase n=1 Tax=Devosia sp. TaxID=1871048 RepID=UPI001B084D99|nr:low-specificity L-threonine aldolase [Devosia sp.]MBO9587365.1 low-specificity L-threonine aldolase [Devosia sp.]